LLKLPAASKRRKRKKKRVERSGTNTQIIMASDESVTDVGLLDEENEEDLIGGGGGEAAAAEEVAADDSNGAAGDDPELEAIKARCREMEEEALKLKQMQSEMDKQLSSAPGAVATGGAAGATSPAGSGVSLMTYEEKVEVDGRSVYVGNVDYGATAEELEQHFHGCGAIQRVTILCNKFNGSPKGFAYVEFTDKDSVDTAMALDDSLFRGRQIKVLPKRTNKPGISTTNRPPRGRGGFRGAARGSRGRGGGFGAMRRPRYRGRGAFYSPY